MANIYSEVKHFKLIMFNECAMILHTCLPQRFSNVVKASYPRCLNIDTMLVYGNFHVRKEELNLDYMDYMYCRVSRYLRNRNQIKHQTFQNFLEYLRNMSSNILFWTFVHEFLSAIFTCQYARQ